MSDARAIASGVVRWALRLTAWFIVVFVAGWIAQEPARAALWGRVMQAHVRFEKRAAIEAIFLEACGSRIADVPAGVRLPGWVPGTLPPVASWFSSADYAGNSPYFVVGPDGRAAWPVLENPREQNLEWAAIPEAFVACGHGGAHVLGAMTFRWGNTGEYEWRFWRHRGEQWEITGVLRARAPSGFGNFETRYRPWRDAVETFTIGRPPVIALRWNRETESFDPPAELPPPFYRYERPGNDELAR